MIWGCIQGGIALMNTVIETNNLTRRFGAKTAVVKMAGKIIGVVKKQFGDRADAALVKQLADEALKG